MTKSVPCTPVATLPEILRNPVFKSKDLKGQTSGS